MHPGRHAALSGGTLWPLCWVGQDVCCKKRRLLAAYTRSESSCHHGGHMETRKKTLKDTTALAAMTTI